MGALGGARHTVSDSRPAQGSPARVSPTAARLRVEESARACIGGQRRVAHRHRFGSGARARSVVRHWLAGGRPHRRRRRIHRAEDVRRPPAPAGRRGRDRGLLAVDRADQGSRRSQRLALRGHQAVGAVIAAAAAAPCHPAHRAGQHRRSDAGARLVRCADAVPVRRPARAGHGHRLGLPAHASPRRSPAWPIRCAPK